MFQIKLINKLILMIQIFGKKYLKIKNLNLKRSLRNFKKIKILKHFNNKKK